jgi:hypothetical protein
MSMATKVTNEVAQTARSPVSMSSETNVNAGSDQYN